MNKLLVFSISMLSVFSTCKDCDDCGDKSVGFYRYAIINSLPSEVAIEFINSDRSRSLLLAGSDTTQMWEMTLLPMASSDLLFTNEGGFDFDVDSVRVFRGTTPLRTFARNFLSQEKPTSSLFNWSDQNNTSYSSDSLGKIGNQFNYNIYYTLDSVNLRLK